jgi:hypothetical protein
MRTIVDKETKELTLCACHRNQIVPRTHSAQRQHNAKPCVHSAAAFWPLGYPTSSLLVRRVGSDVFNLCLCEVRMYLGAFREILVRSSRWVCSRTYHRLSVQLKVVYNMRCIHCPRQDYGQLLACQYIYNEIMR